MEKPTAVIDYKRMVKIGWMGVASSAIVTVMLLLMMDQLAEPYGKYAALAMILLEWVTTAGIFLMSKNQVILDIEGITWKSAFGSKTRSWTEVQKVGIDWVQTNKGKLPGIMLKLSNPGKTMTFECREDILRCILQYYGKPDYDKREK